MNFDQIVHLLTTYEGRINRAKYWIAIVVFIIVQILLGIVSYVFDEIELDLIGAILTGIVGVAVMVAGIFVGIKRLHDRGKSGWWSLLFMFGPTLLVVLGYIVPGIGFIFLLAAAAIGIWAIVELGFLKGDTGPNAYGPDPLPPSVLS